MHDEKRRVVHRHVGDGIGLRSFVSVLEDPAADRLRFRRLRTGDRKSFCHKVGDAIEVDDGSLRDVTVGSRASSANMRYGMGDKPSDLAKLLVE